jgi:hypothetical protein
VRTLRAALLTLVALFATATAASAQMPPRPMLDGPYMRFNLQRPELAVEIPMHFEGGAPESWTVSIWRPGFLPGPDSPGTTEELIARGSGVGAPPAEIAVPSVDPEWRWKLVYQADMETYVRWTWTVGGTTHKTEWLETLSMFTNAGRSAGGADGPPLPGRVPIYTGDGALNPPPDAYFADLGKAVSDRLDASSFLARGRLRKTVKLPWTVPWEGASKLKVRVLFPRGRNPGFGVPVYAGSIRPPDQDGATVAVTARLTPKGRRLATAMGARKVAAKLGTAGIADYWRRPIRGEAPERTWVPIGTCFHDYQRPKRLPCAQTCPPFPGMPTGYLMYTALDSVYGSTTCTKGAALPPVPMG